METKNVFKSVDDLNKAINRENERIKVLNGRLKSLIDVCPHEIVFKFNCNHPRRIPIDGYYFCPACYSTVTCYSKEDLTNTIYRGSRVIHLSNISIVGSPQIYSIMRGEVFQNFDTYYDPNTPSEELQSKMESVLETLQYDYDTISNITLDKKKKGE